MKYILVLVLAMSANAFASNPPEDMTKAFRFECGFEVLGKGKVPDVTCEAKGLFCRSFDLGMLQECENKLAVRCTDDFKLWDESAEVSFSHRNVTLVGNHDDNRAILRIEKLMGGQHDLRFDAELVTSNDGSMFRGSGTCKVHFATQD